MIDLISRLNHNRLTRLAEYQREANAGCDYPSEIDWWLTTVVFPNELADCLRDLAKELGRAASARTPGGNPDVAVMRAALLAVRDAIDAWARGEVVT